MRLVESSEAATSAERAALGEMRRQLREWEEARRQLRSESVERPRDPDDVELTYSRTDARAKVRARRRRAAPPSPPPSPPAPSATPAPARTRSRGTVHINLWTLDAARAGSAGAGPGARRRPLRNGTLDAWLTNAAERDHKLDDNK